ncbi:large conductance mechanosensitive channel [Bacillus mesophilus]|uniref:Large-conductance mechanosensitive channel n=1 Tax=Bacillus mesophilus TaxID=1808955 RepID=A0A6M0Q3B8_9BACI|nr:large conductance mechanosensitive channel protein MscL [Bacillus mesophilus]MBM7659794.1 large conductance mechanosensitive channel [Bacillus mesophilus]NEY70653.1 large conductance mechanosensitive channel protein MscL [Bacillus mesophilus]
MGLIKEFKEFAVKGNVIDLAVGVIIGGAFNKIVSSLVNDIVMPPIGMLLGKVDFTNLFYTLGNKDYKSLSEAQEAGAATINYGIFLNNIIQFLITAFVIFLVIRKINKLKRKEEKVPSAPTDKKCPYCITAIPLKAIKCPQCTADLDLVTT